jgi:hypothetical protein
LGLIKYVVSLNKNHFPTGSYTIGHHGFLIAKKKGELYGVIFETQHIWFF